MELKKEGGGQTKNWIASTAMTELFLLSVNEEKVIPVSVNKKKKFNKTI